MFWLGMGSFSFNYNDLTQVILEEKIKYFFIFLVK